MKVMISQPMRGKTTEQIKEEREKLIREIEKSGNEYVDTIFTNVEPGKENIDLPVYYLAMSIEAMSKVDAVIFMEGWTQARGCRIEHDIAREYGKFIKEI